MKLKDINYTGIFFNDGMHMTWNYGLPRKYPSNIQSGELAEVTVIGKYEDDQVACWVVKYGRYTHQPSGTLLHVTTKVTNGGKAVMSGQRATKNGYEKIKSFKLKGVWR